MLTDFEIVLHHTYKEYLLRCSLLSFEIYILKTQRNEPERAAKTPYHVITRKTDVNKKAKVVILL